MPRILSSEPVSDVYSTAQLALSLRKVEQGAFFSESDPLLIPASLQGKSRHLHPQYEINDSARSATFETAKGESGAAAPKDGSIAAIQHASGGRNNRNKKRENVDPNVFSASVRGIFAWSSSGEHSATDAVRDAVQIDSIEEYRRPSTTVAALAEMEKEAKKQTIKDVEAAVALLPVGYMLERGLHQYLYVHRGSHGLQLFLALQRLQKRISLKLWRAECLRLRELARTQAVVRMQKVARGWRGRLRCKQVSAARSAAERIEMMRRLEVQAVERQAAVKIQRRIRGCLARKHATQLMADYVLKKAAKQAWWHARLYVKCCGMFKSIGRDVQAAKLVQRWWRGTIGRKIAADRRRFAHQRMRVSRLADPEQRFKVYFQYEGAASTIQRWWLALPYCRRNKASCVRRIAKCYAAYRFRRRIAARRQHKQRCARKIQSAWRCYKAAVFEREAPTLAAVSEGTVVSEPVRVDTARTATHQNSGDWQDESHAAAGRALRMRSPVTRATTRLRHTFNFFRRADAARAIQRWWRKTVRRHRALRVWHRRKHRAALAIQRCWRQRRRERAQLRLASLLNPRVTRFLRRKHAASQLARWWRSVYYIHWFMAKRRKILQRLMLVQAVVRGYFARRRVSELLQTARCRKEHDFAGKSMLLQTVVYLKRTIMNKWSRQPRGRVKHETQEIYDILTNNHRGYGLDVNRWVKFLKECPKVINKDFEPSAAELLFTKVREPEEKKINYKQFVKLIEELGQTKFLETRRRTIGNSSRQRSQHNSRVGTQSKYRRRTSEEDESANEEEKLLADAIQHFSHAPLRGVPALFVWAIETFILPSETYGKAYQRLGRANVDAVVDRRVVKLVTTIQRVYRSYRMRLERGRRLQEASLRTRDAQRVRSAVLIQAWARRYLAQLATLRQVQSLYVKFHDPQHEQVYWCNSQTDYMTWSKPLLLGKQDCGEAIPVAPSNCSLVVYCDHCRTKRSIYVCDECDASYCGSCWSEAHSSKALERHQLLPQDFCVECRFQVVTKTCAHCAEGYCASCFQHRHRKGIFREHIAHGTHPVCGQCGQWAAHVLATSYHQERTYYCLVCYYDAFGADATPRSLSTIESRHSWVRYCGPTLTKYRVDKEARLRKAQINAAEQWRRDQMLARKCHSAATTIQRTWRGVLARRRMAEFVQARKEQMKRWWAEYPLRARLSYKIRALVGWAPNLGTDTAYERVLKQYPAWLHRTVREAVDGAWLEAAAMVNERLDFKARPKASGREVLRIVGAYIEARAGVMLSNWMVAYHTKQHEQQRQLFFHTKSTKGQKHRDTQRHKASAEQAAARLGRASNKAALRNEAFAHVQQQLQSLRAPAGIEKLLKEKRSAGVLLDFTVNMYQGYAFAEAPDAHWSRKLKRGQRVQIGDMYFRIAAAATTEQQLQHKTESSEHVGDATARTARSRATDTSYDGADSIPTTRVDEMQLIVDQIDPMLKIPLDRIWPLPTRQGLPISRRIAEPIFSRVFTTTLELLAGSMPAQAVMHSLMRLLHNTSQRMLNAASLRDEEDPLHGLLTAYAQRLQRWQRSVTKHSRTVIRCDQPSNVVLALSAAGTRFLADCRTFATLVVKTFKRNNAARQLSPFARWELSRDKEVVDVYWESGETDANQLLGRITVDLDAPVSVLREKLRRELREPLNQLRGETFVFALGSAALSRLDEERTMTRDVAPLQTDHKTFLASNQLVLLAEPDGVLVSIPVIEMEPELRAALESGLNDDDEDDDDGEEGGDREGGEGGNDGGGD